MFIILNRNARVVMEACGMCRRIWSALARKSERIARQRAKEKCVSDVPGCFSSGSTFSQALENVLEALALHLEGLVADGEALPQAKEVDAHLGNPDYDGGVWAVVDLDLTPYLGKSVRFNASLPENLLLRIDERVNKDHRYASRSGFLATAALRELAV